MIRKIRNIVVATDFSDHASIALDWAVEIARAHQGAITLVHAAWGHDGGGASAEPHAQNAARKLAEAEAQAARWRIPAKGKLLEGKPWEVVLPAAIEARADLIVVGAHGASTLSSRLLGSTADRIVRSSSIPVLVVHQSARGKGQSIRTAVAAIDFSPESASAASLAAGLLRRAPQPARLILLHVVALAVPHPGPAPTIARPEYWDQIEQGARQQLEALAQPLRADGLAVETATRRGVPGPDTIDYCKSVDADLVAVGTVGRSGLQRLLLGSVAEHILHHAACPVLTVRHGE